MERMEGEVERQGRSMYMRKRERKREREREREKARAQPQTEGMPNEPDISRGSNHFHGDRL